MRSIFLIALLATLCLSYELCFNQREVQIYDSPSTMNVLKIADIGDRVQLLGKSDDEWVQVLALSIYFNQTTGFVLAEQLSKCPEEPVLYCNKANVHVYLENNLMAELEFEDAQIGSKFALIEEFGEFAFVQGVVGYVAGHRGFVLREHLEVCPNVVELGAYNSDVARAYAEKWWNSANHQCGKYSACSPYSYWGGESCGYPSQGGDCANLVSQSLVAGGHPYLTGGGDICRGYPCGKEEIGATKLGLCLSQKFGWKRVCGLRQAPPSGLKVGDVIIYHAGSCSSYDAHATIITKMSGGEPYISCHSSNKLNAHYSYLSGSKPYYEYLMK